MEAIRIYKAEEIREMLFTIAGHQFPITTAKELKVYANNVVYIKNKKTTVSESDLKEIERANQIFALYSSSSEGKIYFRDGGFSSSKFAPGYTPSNLEEFKSILSQNNIEIL